MTRGPLCPKTRILPTVRVEVGGWMGKIGGKGGDLERGEALKSGIRSLGKEG